MYANFERIEYVMQIFYLKTNRYLYVFQVFVTKISEILIQNSLLRWRANTFYLFSSTRLLIHTPFLIRMYPIVTFIKSAD